MGLLDRVDGKAKFLTELAQFCQSSNHPMVIAGGFNIIRKETEKNKKGDSLPEIV